MHPERVSAEEGLTIMTRRSSRSAQRIRATTRISPFLILVLLASAGCGARYIRFAEKGMTCTEAQRIAITAVQRMGYTVTDATKPAPGSPGVITASRSDGGHTQGLFVQVFCTTLGVEIEAKTDEGGLAQLQFPSEFKRSFEAAAANRGPQRAAAESGLDVLVTPERATGAPDLAVDLSGTGVMPVSVRITNHSARTYRFRATDVVLQSADGEKAKPVAVKDAIAKLEPAAAETVRQKVLADQDINPNQTLTGFLFFPFKSYTRARVVLTDRASGEPEGFSIEF